MWTYAKTDWEPEWFEHEEYNRIRENVEFLIDLAATLGYQKWNRPPIEALDITSFYFSRVFNSVESNLQLLAKNTLRPREFEETKAFYGNEGTWDDEDVNRIERTTLLFYNMLKSQEEGRRTLAFELGGENFG